MLAHISENYASLLIYIQLIVVVDAELREQNFVLVSSKGTLNHLISHGWSGRSYHRWPNLLQGFFLQCGHPGCPVESVPNTWYCKGC